MAQRYGGKYSPNPQGSTDPDKQPVIVADPADGGVGLKANLLFALPFIFFAKAFAGNASALFVGLAVRWPAASRRLADA